MREAIERIWVRSAVAIVFVTSGVAKLVYANQGVGRFERIGFPAPGALAAFVAVTEIVCAIVLASGRWTRQAAVPLAVIMVVALLTTKVPLLFGAGPEVPAADPKSGVLGALYAARLDLAMLVCCLALAVGPARRAT